jgi:Tfp pilus assembly protein PilV
MKTKKGQSIVETVIAAALISIAVIAALSLANYSQKQTNYSKSLAEATKYNSQVADWLRKEKNALGFATIADKATGDANSDNLAIYCLNAIPDEGSGDFTTLTAGTCPDNSYVDQTIFVRQITVDTTDVSSGTLHVSINISWQETMTRSTTIEVELYQWQ